VDDGVAFSLGNDNVNDNVTCGKQGDDDAEALSRYLLIECSLEGEIKPDSIDKGVYAC